MYLFDLLQKNLISVSLAQPILPDLTNLGWYPILSKIPISAEARLLLQSLKCVCVCVSVCVCVWEKINSPNFKVKYLSNPWSDLPQISNLSSRDQTKIMFGLKFEMKTTSDRPRWKTTSKYKKWFISATTHRIFLKFQT
jgi:hypothetical protein